MEREMELTEEQIKQRAYEMLDRLWRFACANTNVVSLGDEAFRVALAWEAVRQGNEPRRMKTPGKSPNQRNPT